MKIIHLLLFGSMLLIFTACGENKVKDQSIKSEVKALEHNDTDEIQEVEHNRSEPTESKKKLKTVTIYVHGYRKVGYKREKVYGNIFHNGFKKELIKFTGDETFEDYDKESFTNIISAPAFYGDEAPNYYDQEDIDDVEKITKKYGGGVPRYALIVAKFSKFVLESTGADKINIVSVSMGSLMTRWMIEKDLEHLASEGKISKWLTIQGVIRGNYALSNVDNDSLLNIFFENSPDTDHMKYGWIEKHLTPQRAILKSPYYRDILVGQMSLTDGSKTNSLLKYVLPLYGGFQPSDGVQLLKDTYFESVDKNNSQILSHTLLHHDHLGLRHRAEVFANISSFLKAKRRVRVTLVDATVRDLHEEISRSDVGSEIVFESHIFSEEVQKKWELTDAIDERTFESGALKIYNLLEEEQSYQLNQILFDSFVLPSEHQLIVKIEGHEIDSSSLYSIKESNRHLDVDSLGESETTIPLKKGLYAVEAEDWSGHIKVDVLEF